MSAKYKFGSKEIQNFLTQSNDIRFKYFVKRVADWGEVWGLKGSDGWVMSADETGKQVAVFWPFAEFAELCSTGLWEGTIPTSISIEAYTTRWLPGLEKDGRLVGVFPNLLKQAAVINPMQLLHIINDAREELELE